MQLGSRITPTSEWAVPLHCLPQQSKQTTTPVGPQRRGSFNCRCSVAPVTARVLHIRHTQPHVRCSLPQTMQPVVPYTPAGSGRCSSQPGCFAQRCLQRGCTRGELSGCIRLKTGAQQSCQACAKRMRDLQICWLVSSRLGLSLSSQQTSFYWPRSLNQASVRPFECIHTIRGARWRRST